MSIVTVLVLFCPLLLFAQQSVQSKPSTGDHHVYADVGTSPGISLTYNYNFTKHWAVGAGFQGGWWNPAYIGHNRFMPGLFGDIRFNIRPRKNNQFFSFADMGIDCYKRDTRFFRDSILVYDVDHNNGFYTALGFGYLRRMTKRGGGLYTSFRIVLDICRVTTYSFISDEDNERMTWGDGTAVLAIGFKF